jgi:ribosomal protein S18 acetylase RimI-like enzyme
VRDATVRVRQLARGDLRRAAEFCDRARAGDPAIDPFGDRLAALADGPRALLDLWRVARDDAGDVQGIAIAALRQRPGDSGGSPASAEVYAAVAPPLRRKGVGRALCEAALDWASRHRAMLRARARDDAAPGQAFLRALGFRESSAHLSLQWSARRIEAKSKAEIRIRQIGRVDAVAELERLSRSAWDGAPETFPTRANDVERLFESSGRMVLLAESDGRAAGYLSAVWAGRTLLIEEVAVMPPSRRQGIARALLSTALRDASSAVLSVAESNVAGRALYESLGFTRSARHVVYELRHG